MKKYWLYTLLLICALVSFVFSGHNVHAQGSMCEIQPDESVGVDALLSQVSAGTNYGSYNPLSVGEKDTSVNLNRSVVLFDLTCAASSYITDATMYLYQESEASANSVYVDIYRVSSSWSESTVTWNNQPAYSELISSRLFSATEANGEKSFTLDASVIQEMVNGNNYGFIIKTRDELNDMYRLSSALSSTTSQRPRLVLNFVSVTPTPSNTPTVTFTPTITFTPTVTSTRTATPNYTPIVPVSSLVIPTQLRGNLPLYALMGQSNMSGRGILPSSQTTGDVYNFANNYHWEIGIEPIDSPSGQVDEVSEDGADKTWYSPSMAFALAMGEPVGLIPCARGGRSITEFQKAYGDDTLYGSCWKRILAAQQMGDLKGILFMQGEDDAYSLDDANLWAFRFNQMVDALRSDFGNIPIVFARNGNVSLSILPYNNVVRSQQDSIDRYCVEMITTDDLALNGAHYLTAGYDVIGPRFSDTFSNMTHCE